jgi:hypothetical protein
VTTIKTIMDKIYPINITVYKLPKKYVTGLVYSDTELEEVVGYCIEKQYWYTVAYREEEQLQITHES